eukprot:9037784-Lingulodinium_polyedra.AAC.1
MAGWRQDVAAKHGVFRAARSCFRNLLAALVPGQAAAEDVGLAFEGGVRRCNPFADPPFVGRGR